MGRISVFISYAREDSSLVKRIEQYLAEDIEVVYDTKDFTIGTNWKSDFRGLVEKSDIVLFVMSEHSQGSEACLEELKFARDFNKKIIPLLTGRFDSTWNLPDFVKEKTFIQLCESDEEQSFSEVLSAMRVDEDSLRIHRRFLQMAMDWERAGYDDRYLAWGDQLNDGIIWLKSKIKPLPTLVQRQFIGKSKAVEKAEITRIERLKSKSQITQSKYLNDALFEFLTRENISYFNVFDYLNGYNDSRSQIYVSHDKKSEWLFFAAVTTLWNAKCIRSKGLCKLGFSNDGDRLFTVTDDRVLRCWNIKSYELLSEISFRERGFFPSDVALSMDGQRLITLPMNPDICTNGAEIEIWDASDGRKISSVKGRVGESDYVFRVIVSYDNNYLITIAGEQDDNPKGYGNVILWDVATGMMLAVIGENMVNAEFSMNGRYVTMSAELDAIEWDLVKMREIRRSIAVNDEYYIENVTNYSANIIKKSGRAVISEISADHISDIRINSFRDEYVMRAGENVWVKDIHTGCYKVAVDFSSLKPNLRKSEMELIHSQSHEACELVSECNHNYQVMKIRPSSKKVVIRCPKCGDEDTVEPPGRSGIQWSNIEKYNEMIERGVNIPFRYGGDIWNKIEHWLLMIK